jgi:hypothetical protein
MWARLILLAALAGAAPAAADVASERPDAITVTLYHDDGVSTSDLIHPNGDWVRNEGLAFMTETRTIDLPAGPSIVRFRGVVSTIVPQTAEIQGLPAGIAEQNFDYDLLTPGSLLAKSIGETVHLVRTDPKTGKKTEVAAVVRSAPDGTFLDIDGKLEALGCSGLPEKLVFDKIPDGLTDTPTLSVRTVAPAAGRYTIRLSYIATALNWSADYVAHISPDGRTLNLSGWLTLANFSESGFERAPLEVVAGRLNTTGEDEPVTPRSVAATSQCWPTDIDWATYRRLAQLLPPPAPPPPPPPAQYAPFAQETVVVAGARVPDPRLLGDYKLYALPEPTTLAAKQTKQIQFLDQRNVAFEKVYRFDVDLWNDESATDRDAASVVLRLKNDTDSGLGKPLPAGSVSVMDPGNGMPIFAGQAGVSDTSVGAPLELEIGHAMDVQAQQRILASEKNGSGDSERTRKSIEVTITNNKPLPIRFEVRQPMYRPGTSIVSESRDHIAKPNSVAWEIDMAPDNQAILDYTVEVPTR